MSSILKVEETEQNESKNGTVDLELIYWQLCFYHSFKINLQYMIYISTESEFLASGLSDPPLHQVLVHLNQGSIFCDFRYENIKICA